jgi:membrane-associated protease RseP (regulator of RpoE activity)
MTIVLVLLAVVYVAPLLSTGSALLLCRALGIHVETARFWFGPKLFERRWGGVTIEFSCIPGGAHLQLPGLNPYEEEPPPAPAGLRRITDAPRWSQALVFLTGPLSIGLLATAVLGPVAAWHHTVAGLSQIPRGALSPDDVARPLIDAWRALLESRGVLPAAGVVLTKVVAWELLPLTTAPLLRAAFAVLGLLRERWVAILHTVLLVAGMVVAASWLWAFV